MSEIRVNEANCEAVAKELVEKLATKEFSISSFYQPKSDTPKVLRLMRVWGDYSIKDGQVTIRMTPRRNIFWDIRKEIVTIDYQDMGVIILKRVLPGNQVLYRVIVY